MPTTFFSLPAEIRNTIYQHLCFHHETAGIISPIHPELPSTTIISNERFAIIDQQPQLLLDSISNDALERTILRLGTTELQRRRAVWDSSPNVENDHFCTLECLKQPPVCAVNRQIREEALAVFYSCNTFHIELANFPLTRPNGLRDKAVPSCPAHWWRAIGDSNLRMISRLNLGVHVCLTVHKAAWLQFGLRQSRDVEGARVEVVRVQGLAEEMSGHSGHEGHVTECKWARDPRTEGERRFVAFRERKKWRFGGPGVRRVPEEDDQAEMERLKAIREEFYGKVAEVAEGLLRDLRACGLFVAGLEALIVALEPVAVEYVPDHAMLGHDFEVGLTPLGPGEKSLAWRPFHGH